MSICSRILLAIAVLSLFGPAARAASLSGDVTFTFHDWAGPPIPVRLFVPEEGANAAPIVIVIHGASRDAPRYYDDWRSEAEKHGLVVVVPYFSQEDFPGSARFNLGHVFDPETGEPRPPAAWTFAAIEPLFNAVVERLGGRQLQYTMFGHSAGSQFVHRFLYFVPAARVKRAIVANAGWYTMPEFGVAYPYGLGGSGLPNDVLAGYFAHDLVVLLGDADTVRADDKLRKTPEAELQGPHRYARGHTFYRVAKARAESMNVEFRWRLREVPGAAHSNAAMTPAAALFVD